MKTITTQEHDLIISAIGEGATELAAGVLEKDLLLSEVLRTAVTLDCDDVQLVFCGGTCLSKAHGLIQRMSEDIDFKLVVPEGLSRSARSRLFSQLKKRLAIALSDAGFQVPADEVVARDGNNYVSLNLHYQSQFASVASLRPEIKVELIARSPLLATELQPIRSMLDHITQAPGPGLEVVCISVEETLAEKVLSFLRRTAEVRALPNRVEHDERLVRHLYDVQAILRGRSNVVLPNEHFAAMVASDAVQYRNQYPEFEQDPVGQMRVVLNALVEEAAVFERDYLQFVDALVFGESVKFADARDVFVHVAEHLLHQLKP